MLLDNEHEVDTHLYNLKAAAFASSLLKNIYFNDSRPNSAALELNRETPAKLRESRLYKFYVPIFSNA